MNRLITFIVCLLAFNAQAQWQEVYNTTAGRNVAIHFWNKNEGILCAVWSPYIAKTNDGGQNWDTVAVDFLDPTSANLIEMQFTDRNLGFICGGSGFSPYMNILMRTTDGGNSWDSLIVNYPGIWEFTGMDFRVFDNKLLGIVHTYNDVYKVEDSGRTLVHIPQPPGVSGWINEAALVSANRLVVSTGNEIYKTDDWGANWIRVYSDTVYFGKMSFHNTNGISITGEGQILRTANMGDTWVKERVEVDSALLYTVKYAPNGDAYILGSIGQRGYVYGYGNAGKYWSKVLVDPDFEYFADISMPTRDTGYIITNHEVLKTTTGGGLGLKIENMQEMNDGIKLYPNPAHNRLTIEMPVDKALQKVNLYDATGRLAYSYAGKLIDVSALAAGSYFITIETDKGIFRKKLLIQ
jgi:hypothetical protein